MNGASFLNRVRIKNYRSIAGCDVALGPLTFLVGPNASGKSNFLDALRFVADALNTTLDQAILNRGGMGEMTRRAPGVESFGLRVELSLPGGGTGHYAVQIRPTEGVGPLVREECTVHPPSGPSETFDVRSGWVSGTISRLGPTPPGRPDRLYLMAASGLEQFAPVFDGLSRMAFYNVVPDRMRELHPRHATLLARDASNVASVLAQLALEDPFPRQRIQEYLAAIVPGLIGVRPKALGPSETLEFLQRQSGGTPVQPFLASAMSDGTLRALGILVALFQSNDGVARAPCLVGIEEPEAAVHPAAAEVLLDAMQEASARVQVLVTSHSADLLDSKEVETDSLLAVRADNGTTTIGPIDDVGRSALRDGLFTAGELLRLDQLSPDEHTGTDARLQLFDDGGS